MRQVAAIEFPSFISQKYEEEEKKGNGRGRKENEERRNEEMERVKK